MKYIQLFHKLQHRAFGNRSAVLPNPSATEFEVDNWEISRFVVKKLLPAVGLRPFPLSELMLLSAAVCYFRPTHIFEWGTHVGKSARVFYETAKYFKIPCEIHSIDLPDDVEHVENPHSKRGKLVRGKKNVQLHLGDGLDTALGICKTLPEGSRVLFFVDGDHSYESVKRELSGILRNVADPVILAHDTFYQSADSGYNVGPFTAVQEILAEFGTSRKFKVIRTNTGLPGMTLIY